MKIVVFDLDETLGYFTEFGIFWESLKYIFPSIKFSQKEFNQILDLYPEFLRPNILNILNYLKEKKKSNCCHKMMIYTNNNGPREWCKLIINYFEYKIDYKIIDNIIAAFQINGEKIEICRTSNNKSHKDLIKCTKISSNTEICFLDDTFYPDMANDNVFYINIKPYYYDLEFKYLINKFFESSIGKEISKKEITNYQNIDDVLLNQMKNYKYKFIKKENKAYDIDKNIGKHILIHLQDFFNKIKKNKTIKNKSSINKNNKTRKHY